MNTNTIKNRKNEIVEDLKSGKRLFRTVAPFELLTLIADLDPINFFRGTAVLADQLGADPMEMVQMCTAEQLTPPAVDVARHTFLMDDARTEINRYKYERGLLGDDEILAFALFLVVDSALVNDALEYDEVEFDDVAELVNHVASRIKFLMSCLRESRFDVLNSIIQYTKAKKSEGIDTVYLFPTIKADDGGFLDYYKAMTEKDEYPKYVVKEIQKFNEALKDRLDNESEDDGDETTDNAEDGEDDDGSSNYDDYEEPLVERDFEG